MKWNFIYANPGQEGSPLIEINGGNYIRAVAFAANGEYIVGGGEAGEAGVWRVEDGKQIATLAARDVYCLAVSKDGRWIAAGTIWGDVIMWDAKTFEQAFSHKEGTYISGVDFSPDSTRLVTASGNCTATVWNAATRKKVHTLDHKGYVMAAKYSPQGDRIATATYEYVRVWDSNDGRLLVDIPVKVTPGCNKGLLWSNSHLFVVSDSTIKQLEPFTGSTVSEWPVHDASSWSCIALPEHGEFITHSTNYTVTFWNTSTHAQLCLIQHSRHISFIAFSPDDQLLAIGGKYGEITVRSLSPITVSIVGASQQLSYSLVFPNRFQSHCPLCTPPSGYLTFRSTTPCSSHGSMTSSRTQTRYWPQRSPSLGIQPIMYSLVELSSELVCDSGTQPSSTPIRCLLLCSPIH